jgi:hypothetical protein
MSDRKNLINVSQEISVNTNNDKISNIEKKKYINEILLKSLQTDEDIDIDKVIEAASNIIDNKNNDNQNTKRISKNKNNDNNYNQKQETKSIDIDDLLFKNKTTKNCQNNPSVIGNSNEKREVDNFPTNLKRKIQLEKVINIKSEVEIAEEEEKRLKQYEIEESKEEKSLENGSNSDDDDGDFFEDYYCTENILGFIKLFILIN